MRSANQLTADLLREMPLPLPEHGGKGERGTVLVAGGSREVPGAALLAGEAALRAGAGRVQVATCSGHASLLGMALPEARVIGLEESESGGISRSAADRLASLAERCDALLLGPGLFEEADLDELIHRVLGRTSGFGLVLDAGALANLCSQRDALREHGGRMVLTPHAGEMARLLDRDADEVEREPLDAAREAAALLRAVVVMKGPETDIVSPQGESWHFAGGTVGLGTSGSGDVLAGILAGLLARGATPLQAALWAVYLHGEAGRLTQATGLLGFLAREIPGQVPSLLSELSA